MTHYPTHPGAKELHGTSEQAAVAIEPEAKTLRDRVLSVLKTFGPWTADEIATYLGRSVLSIRPRVSELHEMGRIRKTGQRRKNASGQSAAVWEVAPVVESGWLF